MRDLDFKKWLSEKGLVASSVATRLSDARRVETHYGDLDTAFAQDRLDNILAYSTTDRAADRTNPSLIVIDGDVYDGLGTYRAAVNSYKRFAADREGSAPETQADRVRRYTNENFVEPARARQEPSIEVVSGDIHRAMRLENAMPAVCSALGSSKFEMLANVKLTDRQGPANSSTVRFSFALSTSPA